MKGYLYDNAVTKASFKVFKTKKFANEAHFTSFEFNDYIYWFNNI